MTKSDTQHPPPFVLLHGAFRGGWSWRKVQKILSENGRRSYAPDLTGAGNKSHLNSPDITLKVWTNDVVNMIKEKELKDLILVGHSQGGIVAQAVAETSAKRVSNIVFLDAPVLQNGERAIDVIPSDVRKKFGEPERNSMVAPIPITPNEDFSEDEAQWINKRLTPVPTNPSFEPITIENSLRIPHTYVFCEKTPPVFPASFTRKRFYEEEVYYQLIDAGHDAPLSHPELVADVLLNL